LISLTPIQKITLSKSAAMEEITNIHAQLSAVPASDLFKAFGNIAFERSDCGSCRNYGDLGPFERGQMQKPFEDASFGLEVGAMSGIVDTDSGLHIIFRSA
jgi:NIMA-interacting peptidyl-prolyl cis-trans isomerase 1